MKSEDRHIQAEELSAFLDDDLEACRQQEVGLHLQSCETCRKVADELGLMRQGLLALADTEPQRELWPAICRALEPGEDRSLGSWWRRFWMIPVFSMAGAAVMLLVMLVSGLFNQGVNQPAGPVQALEAVTNAEIEYNRAIESLEKVLTQNQLNWSPQVREIVQHGLAEIDQSIAKCRRALSSNPSDRETQETMLAAYQHKVDFMTELLADTLAE